MGGICDNGRRLSQLLREQVPLEAKNAINVEHTNFFLDQMSDLPLKTNHFFDESSVVKTTMNRRYGNAPLGEPAYEIQRYASNANFTINLLHSMQGIDYVNVIDGAPNGFELLFFFEEAEICYHELTSQSELMHLSMLSRRGGRQGIGRGFDRHSWPVGRAFDRFSCPRGRII